MVIEAPWGFCRSHGGELRRKPLGLLWPPKLKMGRQQVGRRWTPSRAGASQSPVWGGGRLRLVSAPVSCKGERGPFVFPLANLCCVDAQGGCLAGVESRL